MSTKQAIEYGPATPDKIPCLGYYDAEDGAAIVHKLTLSGSTPASTPPISAGVTAVRIAPTENCHIVDGPEESSPADKTPHWGLTSEVVKVGAPGNVFSAVNASGVADGIVYITELH